jgi:hypothetical protein
VVALVECFERLVLVGVRARVPATSYQLE